MGAKSRIPFDFTNKADIFRVECTQKASSYWSGWLKKSLKITWFPTTAKKGLKTWQSDLLSLYFSVWMYVIREMEDAVTDCTAGHSHKFFFKLMTLKKT